MRRLLLVVALAGAIGAWPAASNAGTVTGIVIGKERATLLVATPSGAVTAVRGDASIGSRIVVGTNTIRRVGLVRHALLRGVVVRRIGSTLLLASSHHLVAIRAPRIVAAAGHKPARHIRPGDVVAAEIEIENENELNEERIELVDRVPFVTVQAPVVAVAEGAVTLNVQGRNVLVRLPAGLTLPASLVGQTVGIRLVFHDAEDEHEHEGDDANRGLDRTGPAEPATTQPTVGVADRGDRRGGGDDGDGDRSGPGGGDR